MGTYTVSKHRTLKALRETVARYRAAIEAVQEDTGMIPVLFDSDICPICVANDSCSTCVMWTVAHFMGCSCTKGYKEAHDTYKAWIGRDITASDSKLVTALEGRIQVLEEVRRVVQKLDARTLKARSASRRENDVWPELAHLLQHHDYEEDRHAE